MPTLVFESDLPCSVEELWAFHSDVSALKLLAPQGASVEILGPDTGVFEGALHRLKIKRMGLPLRWDARIHAVNPPYGFTDTAERSPFKQWSHEHRFERTETGCRLIDRVTFEIFPLLTPLVKWDVQKMFAHRHRVTREYFAQR